MLNIPAIILIVVMLLISAYVPLLGIFIIAFILLGLGGFFSFIKALMNDENKHSQDRYEKVKQHNNVTDKDIMDMLKALKGDVSTIRDDRIHYGNQFMSAEEKTEYMKSPQWKELKNQRLITANQQCEICSSPKYLHLHHTHYMHLGDEPIYDVVILCTKCHQNQHDHYGYDRTTIYLPLIKETT